MNKFHSSFFSRLRLHWNGHENWLFLLLINLFCISVVVKFLLNFSVNFTPLFFWITLTLIACILFWQLTGGVKAALYQQNRSSGFAKSVVLVASVLTIFFTTIFGIFGVVSNRNIDPNLGKYIPPASIVSVRNEGGVIEINGEIDYRTLTDLQPFLNSDLITLVLNSKGGNVFAARVISRKLVGLNVETKIIDRCFSACSMIFLSGDSRVLGPNGKLGFHGYSVEGKLRSHLIDIENEQQIDKMFYRSRGLDWNFIDRAFSFGSNENWIPSREVLIDAGALTQQ